MSGVQSKLSSARELKVVNEDNLEHLLVKHLMQKVQSWKTKAENTETALKQANTKIAYLNKKPRKNLGIEPQTTSGIDVVYPGVSRKDFDALTKENIRLKEALEHIAPTELGSKDIVIKSLEHGTTWQDDDSHYEDNIKQVNATAAIAHEKKEKLEKVIEGKNKLLLEEQEKNQELKRKNEHLSKRVTELAAEVINTNESKKKIEAVLGETSKKNADLQKKCNRFFNQFMRLYSKKCDEISSLNQSHQNLCAQFSEQEAMLDLMQVQLDSYKEDFRDERDEKNAIKIRFESQSAELRHLENKIDRMQDANICMPLPIQEHGEHHDDIQS